MPKQLDISSLTNAVRSLSEALDERTRQPENKFVRDATIQRFEYTYELSHKMLKRYLEMSEPNAEEVDQMGFPDLIRTGSGRGLLLNGWDKWIEYRTARNLTSHTYNESKAAEVCKVIPAFLRDANHLVATLQERIKNNAS